MTQTSAVPDNPYVGLRPFETADSPFYFGRDDQTLEMLEILHHHRFLPIVGSSGSGKTSLVKAGLIPQLQLGFLVARREHWRIATMRPGISPVKNLASALVSAFASAPSPVLPEALEHDLRVGHTDALLAYVGARLDTSESLLVIIDQFEELFAFRGQDRDDDDLLSEERRKRARHRAEASAFVELLLGIAKTRQQPIFVATTMRSDFLGDCDLFYGLPEAMNKGRYLVPRMSRGQLAQAIEGPAKMAGTKVSARLLDHLRNELGDRFDRLPMLQHALQRTFAEWVRDGSPSAIDIAHYERAGEIERALNADAELALVQSPDGTPDELPLPLVERVFKALTDSDAQRRRVRHPMLRSELVAASGASAADVMAVVDRFAEAPRNFLVTLDGERPDDPRIDITHESLIRQWSRLRTWVDEERDSRDRFLDLVKRARTWQEDREPLKGAQLAIAAQWRRRAEINAAWAKRYATRDDDFATTDAFISSSERAARRRVRNRRLASAAFVVALSGIALWLWRAERDSRDALIVRVARSLAASDPTSAALLFGELSSPASDVPGGVVALHTVAATPFARRMIQETTAADLSPDGTVLAYAKGSDVYLVGTGTHRPIATMRGSGTVSLLKFGPDGRTIVGVGSDSSALIWSAADGRLVAPVATRSRAEQPARSVFFSTDGSVVGGVSYDARVRLWNARDGTLISTPGDSSRASVTALSHDGRQLLVGGYDGAVRLFDARSGNLVRAFAGLTGTVVNLEMSDDGSRIIGSAASDTAIVWNTTTGKMVVPEKADARPVVATFRPGTTEPMVGAWNRVYRYFADSQLTNVRVQFADAELLGAAFNRAGSIIVAPSRNRELLVWETCDRVQTRLPVRVCEDSELTRLKYVSPISSYAVGSNGAVAIRTVDSVTTLWLLGRVLATHSAHLTPGLLLAAAIIGRGDSVFFVSDDKVAGLSRLEQSPQSLWTAKLVDAGLQDATIVPGPDGVRVGSFNLMSGTAFVWPSAAVSNYRTLSEPAAGVRDLAFTPDGKEVAVLTSAGVVHAWNAVTGQDMGPLFTPANGISATAVAGSTVSARFAIGRSDGRVDLVDADSRVSRSSFRPGTRAITHLAFSPGDKHLAVADSGVTLQIWDTGVDPQHVVLRGHTGRINSIMFSPSGPTLVSASEDNTAIVWDINKARMVLELRGHRSAVDRAVYNLAGDQVLTSSAKDGSQRVWTLDGQSDPIVLYGAPFTIGTFAPDGRRVVSIDSAGGVRISAVNGTLLQGIIRGAVSGCLAPAFRVRFLHEWDWWATWKWRACERSARTQ